MDTIPTPLTSRCNNDTTTNAGRYKWTGHWSRLIEGKLRLQWSPEQISGWLFWHHRFSLSHERIYQHIRADRVAGGSLYTHLRHRLGTRRSFSSTDYKGRVSNRVSIDDRPLIVEEKTRIGDWEGDLMMGGQGGGALATLVDRKSRWTRQDASTPSRPRK